MRTKYHLHRLRQDTGKDSEFIHVEYWLFFGNREYFTLTPQEKKEKKKKKKSNISVHAANFKAKMKRNSGLTPETLIGYGYATAVEVKYHKPK